MLVGNFESKFDTYIKNVLEKSDDQLQRNHRHTRGIATIFGAGIIGGTFAGSVIPKLVEHSISVSELREASKRTEEILDTLRERTNVLDKNQLKLGGALSRLMQLSNSGFLQQNIQEIKINANSILIDLGTRLELLMKLTEKPTSNRSYMLLMNLPEIKHVIISAYPRIRIGDINDNNILYSFQVSQEGQIYFILQVLLPNSLRIKNFVNVINWPKISNNSLMAKSSNFDQWYILLTDDYFVETTLVWIQQCIQFPESCFTDAIPMKVVSGMLNPAMSQYFDIKAKRQESIKMGKPVFIMSLGQNFLVYTTIEPIEIRINCERRKSETVNLIGRGLHEIINGCRVSSPFLSMILPQEVGSINYTTFSTPSNLRYENVHFWNTSHFESEMKLDSLPLEKPYDISSKYQHFLGGTFWGNALIVVPSIIFILTFVLCITGMMNLFRNNQSRQRETFL